jgi:hypothetical protein
VWRTQLHALVRDGMPGTVHHPNAPLIGTLCALIGSVPLLQELVDELADEGELDKTPRAEVVTKEAEFATREKALQLAAEQVEVERIEAEARVEREAFDRRVEEQLAK